MGFLPQWNCHGVVESVPWRDKGGPRYDDDKVLKCFIEETQRIVQTKGLKGFCWRNFKTDFLDSYSHLVNVTIDLTKYTPETFPKAVGFKVRGKVKNALSNGLTWIVEQDALPAHLRSFYHLFRTRRKELGVPAYPFRLFESYFRHIPSSRIKLFNVYRENKTIASLILLHNKHIAIDAYSASNAQGMELKANDLMIHEVILYCIRQNIKTFDFGADSPFQKSLIQYKMKWLGTINPVNVAYFGKIRERDHNEPRYDAFKRLIRIMPMQAYSFFSRMIVK